MMNLVKSVCNADTRDESIPKFTQTEKALMKVFYKNKHDRRFMLVENHVFLNILRKLSKYLKKF